MRIGEINTREFVNQIDIIADSVSPTSTVKDSAGVYNEKKHLKNLVFEANELIKNNEWIIALENIVGNLHEVDYKLNKDVLQFAQNAFDDLNVKSDYSDCINHLQMIDN